VKSDLFFGESCVRCGAAAETFGERIAIFTRVVEHDTQHSEELVAVTRCRACGFLREVVMVEQPLLRSSTCSLGVMIA